MQLLHDWYETLPPATIQESRIDEGDPYGIKYRTFKTLTTQLIHHNWTGETTDGRVTTKIIYVGQASLTTKLSDRVMFRTNSADTVSIFWLQKALTTRLSTHTQYIEGVIMFLLHMYSSPKTIQDLPASQYTVAARVALLLCVTSVPSHCRNIVVSWWWPSLQSQSTLPSKEWVLR